jgi:hypothetical protein
MADDVTPLRFPLRVKRVGESFQIIDAAGRSILMYFEDDETRRSIMNRWTSAEAEALAKQIARALTDNKKGRATPKDDAAK